MFTRTSGKNVSSTGTQHLVVLSYYSKSTQCEREGNSIANFKAQQREHVIMEH